jgi:hypothetical protein
MLVEILALGQTAKKADEIASPLSISAFDRNGISKSLKGPGHRWRDLLRY